MRLRALLHELADALADQVELSGHTAEYYDQRDSPLGKEHARLVRSGKLSGFKIGRRILIKRSDVHAFIELHKVKPTASALTADNEDELASDLLAKLRRVG